MIEQHFRLPGTLRNAKLPLLNSSFDIMNFFIVEYYMLLQTVYIIQTLFWQKVVL